MNAAAPPSPPAARLRPRDAATLVIVDHTGREPRILMGRRRPDQVFLPNTYVFPGGRVEASDRAAARHHALAPRESACVQRHMPGKPSDRRASALALAALRETYEETGVLVGTSGDIGGDSLTWAAQLDAGFTPGLTRLTYLARAITPPARPRRYDTRFFIVEASAIAHQAPRTDGELLDIGWFAIAEAQRLALPSITRHILEDIAAYVRLPAARRPALAVPFYAHRRGLLERTLLERP